MMSYRARRRNHFAVRLHCLSCRSGLPAAFVPRRLRAHFPPLRRLPPLGLPARLEKPPNEPQMHDRPQPVRLGQDQRWLWWLHRSTLAVLHRQKSATWFLPPQTPLCSDNGKKSMFLRNKRPLFGKKSGKLNTANDTSVESVGLPEVFADVQLLLPLVALAHFGW